MTATTSTPTAAPAGTKGRSARRFAAHLTFEVLVELGLSRTIAFEVAWRMWGR